MPRLKRREREIEQTRRHIIDAASRVFARKSFNEASMQEIAAEAGFSAASLYAYFDGKQALIRALAESLHEETDAILNRPLPESLTFPQRLELMLMRQYEWIEAHETDFMVLAREVRFHEAMEDLQACDAPSQVAGLTAWIEAHARPGELGSRAAEEAAWLLWGVTRGSIARWVHGGREVPLPRQVPRIVDFFLHGLLGGAEPAGAEAKRKGGEA